MAFICVFAVNFVDIHWKSIFRAEYLADAFVQQVSWQLCMKSYFSPFTGTGQRLRFAFGDIALIVSLETARAAEGKLAFPDSHLLLTPSFLSSNSSVYACSMAACRPSCFAGTSSFHLVLSPVYRIDGRRCPVILAQLAAVDARCF